MNILLKQNLILKKWVEKKLTEENKTIIDEQTTPKTGDEVYIYIIGAIISLLLIVGLVFVLVKNKKKSE